MDRRGRVYTPMHMRFHLLKYVNENKESLSRLLKGPLEVRGMSLNEYELMMYNNQTCGYEITLLLLSMMYMVPILVIRSDMLWVSQNVMPADCAIVLVQNSVGQFMGTKSKYPVFVYEIPKIRLRQVRANIRRFGLVHSTPLRSGSNAEFMEGSIGAMLSPICDTSTSKKSENIQQEDTKSDHSLERIRRDIDSFEKKSLKDSCSLSTEYPEGEFNVMESSKDADLSTTIDPNNNSTEISQEKGVDVSPVNSATTNQQREDTNKDQQGHEVSSVNSETKQDEESEYNYEDAQDETTDPLKSKTNENKGMTTNSEQQLRAGSPVNSEELSDEETEDAYQDAYYDTNGSVNSEILPTNADVGVNIGGTGIEHDENGTSGIVNSATLTQSGGLNGEEFPNENRKTVVSIDDSKLNSCKLFSSEDEIVGETMRKHELNGTASTVVFTESGVSDRDKTLVEHDETMTKHESNGTASTVVFTKSGVSDPDRTFVEPNDTPDTTDEDKTIVGSSGNSDSDKRNDDKEDTSCNSSPVTEEQSVLASSGNPEADNKKDDEQYTGHISNPVDAEEENYESDATEPLDDGGTTVDDGNHSPVNSDTEMKQPEINITQKRLGMTGSVSKFRNLRLSMVDLKDQLDEMEMDPDISYVVESDENSPKMSKVKQYCCTKCNTAKWTLDGYESHLLQEHNIRNVKKYPPTVMTRTILPPSTSNSSVEVVYNEEDKKSKVEEPETDEEDYDPYKAEKYLAKPLSAEDKELLGDMEFNITTAQILMRPDYDTEKKKEMLLAKYNESNPTHRNYKPFQCSFCSERFFYTTGLNHHEKSHDVENKLPKLFQPTQTTNVEDIPQISDMNNGTVNSAAPIQKTTLRVTAEIHEAKTVNSVSTPKQGRKRKRKSHCWTKVKRSQANRAVLVNEEDERKKDEEIGTAALKRLQKKKRDEEEAMLESIKATYNLRQRDMAAEKNEDQSIASQKDKEANSSEMKEDVTNEKIEKVSQITSPEEKEENPNGDNHIETKEKTPEEQPILKQDDLKDPISRRTRSKTSMPTEDHLDRKEDKAEIEA